VLTSVRDVLCALPEHCGRAGGSWRFSRVNCREGSSRNAFRRGNWLPGRCGLLTESSTHGRTGRWPPECCRSICEVRFADGDLPSAIVLRALSGAPVSDELPHAACVEMGHGIFRQTNAVQVAGLGRICFGSSFPVLSRQLSGVRANGLLPVIHLHSFFIRLYSHQISGSLRWTEESATGRPRFLDSG
jgi:hypothetical protein